PFPLLAVAARDARTRHREADRPERAEQLTIPMAVPVARTPGRTVIPPASQRRCQLLLHQALDECADLLPNTGFQRIEPVRSQQWNLCLDRDILPHGVISSGGANRRSWVETSGDYATFQFPPPARRDPAIVWDPLVDEVFSELKSSFIEMPKGEGFIDYPTFETGYQT